MGTLNIFPLNMRDIPGFGYAVLYENGDMKKLSSLNIWDFKENKK